MISAQVLFPATVAVGLISLGFAFFAASRRHSEVNQWYVLRAVSLSIVVLGFVLHTLGDFLIPVYGESVEMLCESIAHVIISVGAVLLLLVSKEIVILADRYGYGGR